MNDGMGTIELDKDYLMNKLAVEVRVLEQKVSMLQSILYSLVGTITLAAAAGLIVQLIK